MKKVFLLTGAVVGVLVLFQVCFAATSDAKLPMSSKPIIASIIGSTAATLADTRWPELVSRFGGVISDACWAEAQVKISNQRKSNLWNGEIPLPKELFSIVPMDGNSEISIPLRNRKDSKILISWTLDIMADDPANQQPPVPVLYDAVAMPHCPHASDCSSTSGGCSVTEYLPGGIVYVQAFVNGVKHGDQVAYSLPGGITIANWAIPYVPPRRCDPTCSGSFMLDKDDYNGTFPAKLKLELGWYNDSAVKIKAPAKRRIINVLIEPAS